MASWKEDRLYVRETLEEVRKDVKQLREDVVILRTKATIFGALAGGLSSLVVAILSILASGNFPFSS
jgi:hypothetical protein